MARPAPFPTVRSEGGLVPPDLLQRVVDADPTLGGFTPADFQLAGTTTIREAVARSWTSARAYWTSFQEASGYLRPGDSGVTETRDQWVLPLLRTMGYDDLAYQAAAEEVDGRRYPISHRAGGVVPVHVASFKEDLERSPRGAGRQAPHGLVQDFLNRRPNALYGIVTNGFTLRLLRDNHSLTRLAYVEFDLRGMLEGAVYADFVLLWLLLHRTRLPRAGLEEACWLEKWRATAEAGGTRAMGELRRGVERALEALGTGLLAHPANARLRARLTASEGGLSTTEFYGQLLRLLYRLLFLFVAEERDLLFGPAATQMQRQRYAAHLSVSRLRDLVGRARDDERHDDLWRSVCLVFDVLAGRRDQTGLGLPVLGGGLFGAEGCPDIDGETDTGPALVSNAALAKTIEALSRVYVNKRWRRVNYREMDAEELGGVYEGLLDKQPSIRAEVANPHFAFAGSGERKQTGSYYTPSTLVQELIKSALDPVIEDRLAGARTAAQQEAALLGITVCDAAAGSGHFLVAAARRLADALARTRAGADEPTPTLVRQALRDVIRHCLYGVDVNPLAVDLCRLSLWLEGHDAGRPLSFLDHRVKLGNSLVGATPDLVLGGVPEGAFEPVTGDVKAVAAAWKHRNRGERSAITKERERQATYLAGAGVRSDWGALVIDLGKASAAIGAIPEDDLSARSEGGSGRGLAEQRSRYEKFRHDQVEPVRATLDAWAAAFFWPLRPDAPPPPTSAAFHVHSGSQPLLSPAQRGVVQDLRERYEFFHWDLEFPEVFGAEKGGFDCVLGNPPWERIKLQEQEFFAERDPAIAGAANKSARQKLIDTLPQRNPALARAFVDAKRVAEGQSAFVRGSGRFPLTAVGDVNLYALFAEQDCALLGGTGRAGILVPTGIATDDSTKAFFGDLVDRRVLVSYFGFKNEQHLFPMPVEHTVTFGLLTVFGRVLKANQIELTWFAYNMNHLNNPDRRVVLSPDDLALLNPNTRTCPIFRTRADAELTRAIYRRVPVLVDERRGLNPWGVEFLTMFHMSNDSGLFRDAPGPRLVPLYEAKLFHQFNHRWATFAGGDARDATPIEIADPAWTVRPRYWIERAEVDARLPNPQKWMVASRMMARATDEHTLIVGLLPRAGAGNSAAIWRISEELGAKSVAALLANANSLVLDFTVRQKVGGANLNFFIVNQFPVLPPSSYTPADLDFVSLRVLELTYTANDLEAFARDLGHHGPPFAWDEERRALLRAELDAYYAALYGLSRDELRYVLDPADVYGPEFQAKHSAY